MSHENYDYWYLVGHSLMGGSVWKFNLEYPVYIFVALLKLCLQAVSFFTLAIFLAFAAEEFVVHARLIRADLLVFTFAEIGIILLPLLENKYNAITAKRTADNIFSYFNLYETRKSLYDAWTHSPERVFGVVNTLYWILQDSPEILADLQSRLFESILFNGIFVGLLFYTGNIWIGIAGLVGVILFFIGFVLYFGTVKMGLRKQNGIAARFKDQNSGEYYSILSQQQGIVNPVLPLLETCAPPSREIVDSREYFDLRTYKFKRTQALYAVIQIFVLAVVLLGSTYILSIMNKIILLIVIYFPRIFLYCSVFYDFEMHRYKRRMQLVGISDIVSKCTTPSGRDDDDDDDLVIYGHSLLTNDDSPIIHIERGLHSFDVIPHKVQLVDGGSGAGKTLYMKGLFGVSRQRSGSDITVSLNNNKTITVSSLQTRAVFIQQNILSLYSWNERLLLTAENLFGNNYTLFKPILRDVFFIKENVLPKSPQKTFNTFLSTGEKQRLVLASYFVRFLYEKKPDIIIMDEYDANLDPKTSISIIGWAIKNIPAFFVLSTHHNEVKEFLTKNDHVSSVIKIT